MPTKRPVATGLSSVATGLSSVAYFSKSEATAKGVAGPDSRTVGGVGGGAMITEKKSLTPPNPYVILSEKWQSHTV